MKQGVNEGIGHDAGIYVVSLSYFFIFFIQQNTL